MVSASHYAFVAMISWPTLINATLIAKTCDTAEGRTRSPYDLESIVKVQIHAK